MGHKEVVLWFTLEGLEALQKALEVYVEQGDGAFDDEVDKIYQQIEDTKRRFPGGRDNPKGKDNPK